MTNRYFDFPDERLTLCVGVIIGSAAAKATSKRIRDYFGKTGKIREIDSTEYTRLTDIYTNGKLPEVR
jgi:hypothetical protein